MLISLFDISFNIFLAYILFVLRGKGDGSIKSSKGGRKNNYSANDVLSTLPYPLDKRLHIDDIDTMEVLKVSDMRVS